MTITVIIPTLNEERTLAPTLLHTSELGFDHIVVVDAGSTDRTREIVESILRNRLQGSAARLELSTPISTADTSSIHRSSPMTHHVELSSISFLISTPGRARQFNHGAMGSQDDVLVFLHADTLLPLDARAMIEEALVESSCVGGRFDLRFDHDEGWEWMISRLINVRSRWTGIATGDQGMFVRRSVFEQLGGFADIPIMEDVDLSRRMKQRGHLVAIRSMALTSFRRWESCGPIRTILLMWMLRFLYWVGVSPNRLTHLYGMVR